jgi:hypothetical protein
MKNVRTVEQLAIFIANRPGTLADVCDALAEANINIYGLTVSDTVDHAAVRMVVSDTRRAIALLESHGTLVLDSEVLMIENDNRPGSLSRVARLLAKSKINIEYAYIDVVFGLKSVCIAHCVRDVESIELLVWNHHSDCEHNAYRYADAVVNSELDAESD